MNQHHRVVSEERTVLVTPDEIDQEFIDRFRAVLVNLALAVGHDVAIPVALTARRSIAGFVAGPDAVLIKTVALQGIRMLPEIIDLPLARDRGGVAGFFHYPCKGGEFLPIKPLAAPARDIMMTNPAGSERVLPGKQFHPGRGADRGTPAVFEPNPPGREAVYIRSRMRGSVTGDPVTPHIVNHDKYDIGLCFSRCRS